MDVLHNSRTQENTMSKITLTGVGDVDDNVAFNPDDERVLVNDELHVAMEAAPIAPVDFLLAQGWYGVPATVGMTLGSEGVGRVVDTGPEADASLLGRRVIILPTYESGTWAERIIVHSRSVVAVTDDADPLQLAMLAVNPATAHLLLTRYGSLKPGDWIGLTIGNSAINQYIIALAKRAGYKTLSVVRREEAAQQVRSSGGDAVVLAGENLEERVEEVLGDQKFALVLDGEGGDSVGVLARSLVFRGTVVAYSSMTGASQVLGLGDLIFNELELRGFWLINWIRNAPRDEIEATYAELASLVASGVLSAAVEATYPLTDYREAFAKARSAGRAGKVLFTF
jgi:NADPH:quinone reductase-like Zn-dependent oxidoreductase